MSESVTSLFDASVAKFNERPAFQFFSRTKNAWCTMSWLEVSKTVARLANALKHLGLSKSDRVAIISETRPEWVICDIAIMKALGVVVPIYHSSLSDQVSYILTDSAAKIVFVENASQLKKVREVDGLNLQRVIVFDDINEPLLANEVYFEDLIKTENDHFVGAKLDKDDLASLVYTSGTTGEPKGAMMTHDNFLYEAQVIERLGVLTKDDVQLLFLPLAHIFARVLEVAWIQTGHLLAFAQSVDAIVDNMAVIRPTFMAGVPRIFEKVRAKVIDKAQSSPGIKGRIAKFAFHQAGVLAKNPKARGLKLCISKKLVFDKIGRELKSKFGGRIRFFVSGGAQLSSEVATFFSLCGITLCEGYGLTETTAATCLNLPWALRYGTVGKALPGTEVKLAEDGEILVRGRGVFKGFFNRETETKEVFDAAGWFHTGDIGSIDGDGYVKIIDRKKDIIITSQGKNIAPARVENLVKAKSPMIAQVVVVGDKRPYLTALVALDKANANAMVSPSQELSMSELSSNTAVFEEVKNAVARANAALASFEQIKRFHILDREFEVGKELTPTLKVKRKHAIKIFSKEVNGLYT